MGEVPTDTDDDGLFDWDEVDIEFISNFVRFSPSPHINNIQTSYLPSLKDFIKHYEWKFYAEDMDEKLVQKYGDTHLIDEYRILPILSAPTEPDSDGDGFYDCITGKYKPMGYYKVVDEWPLTSKPYVSFYQKDGEHYFNQLTISNQSGSLPEEIQKFVYNMCAEPQLRIDPNMIFAIALHESGFDPTAENESRRPDGTKLSTASGYMQLLDRNWDYYKPNGYYYNNYRVVYEKYGVEFINKNDPISNLAVGMCLYAQGIKDQKIKNPNATLEVIVGYYGEGPYAVSTKQIIEFYQEISNLLNPLSFSNLDN
jgi:hypothetical protein